MSVQFCLSIEDAKTKWCPAAQSRVILHRGKSIGFCLDEHEGARTTCVATACMAWRFVETHIPEEDGNLTVKSGDTHGFCGLAGIPSGAQH